MSNEPKVGDRIRFIKKLWSGPDDYSPGNLYARRGEEGTIVEIGKCWEGFMVKTDDWDAPFGAEIDKEFVLIDK